MGILKLIFILISVLIGVVRAIVWFNHRCDRRFGHTFFTLRAFCQAAVGVNFMWGGNYFPQIALRQHARFQAPSSSLPLVSDSYSG